MLKRKASLRLSCLLTLSLSPVSFAQAPQSSNAQMSASIQCGPQCIEYGLLIAPDPRLGGVHLSHPVAHSAHAASPHPSANSSAVVQRDTPQQR